jgi:multidrug resistance efflux pump
LFQLDPRQFQIAFDNATANLSQVSLTLQSMKHIVVCLAMSPRSKRKLNWTRQIERYATLARTDVVSRANYDESRFALQADKNKLQSLQQQAKRPACQARRQC